MKNNIFGCFELAPIGLVWTALEGGEVVALAIGGSEMSIRGSLCPEPIWIKSDKEVAHLKHSLGKMLFGEKVNSPKYKITRGTIFQRKVWSEIAKIPFGKTISYSELARHCKRPKSVRAVANACGANPLPIIIPCHRVVKKGGDIGGFSCGVHIKKRLLSLEGNEL